MHLTFHGHSCVSLEHAGTRLILDPGTFADAASALSGSGTLFLTHAHPDHLDVEAVRAALVRHPDLRVFGPREAFDRLGQAPDGERLRVVEPGDVLTVGPFLVLVGGGLHAVIHPDIPRIANLTYLVLAAGTRTYHPGDSFDLPATDERLDLLLAPVSAPWLKVSEAIDFVRGLDPRTVVPVHVGVLSPVGGGLVHRLFDEGRTGGTYDYRRLEVGQGLEIAAGRARDPGLVAQELLREHPEFDDVPTLEVDETVPPRPEEEVADATREQGSADLR